jgi:hypothetical protein
MKMVQQQHLYLILAASLPLSGSAFSTARRLQTSALVRPSADFRRTTRVVLSIDARSTEEQSTVTTNTAEIEPSEDFARELILANIAKASPESLFGSSTLTVSGAEDESTPSTSAPLGPSLNTSTTIKSVAELGQEINQQVVTTRNVNAVLAASEEAMIAAEASLPTDVKEELEVFASTAMATNNTDIRPPTTLRDPVKKVPSVTGPATKTPLRIEAPTVMTILKFAIPAVGVWLCSPMLSLIDTSAVGILSGTTQQAALNPAVAVTDYAALLMVSRGVFRCSIGELQTHISLALVATRLSYIPALQILWLRLKNLIGRVQESRLPRPP